ncbi:MAG: hypothetical protein IJ233_12165 [Pyramidobacter sp.]|nr:hypothetical protein [Pyramidobacter sp.]
MRLFELSNGVELLLKRSAVVRFPDKSIVYCEEDETGIQAHDMGGDAETTQAAVFCDKFERMTKGNKFKEQEVNAAEKQIFALLIMVLLNIGDEDKTQTAVAKYLHYKGANS